ncbi:hypothetical protein TrRE_jg11252 [Triparma retinervis]|uniref:Uncharacterized protein n=1 Tax=Triparma retinervis TaxID=2557542 RepID=A0A9W7E2K5_9STRA|nr:hypothetical protein TrRE_jg11252 [Triparma retinervis]
MGRGQQSHGTQRRKQFRAKDRAKEKQDKKNGADAGAGEGTTKTTHQQGWADGTGLLGLLFGWIVIMVVVGYSMGGRNTNVTSMSSSSKSRATSSPNLDKAPTLSTDSIRDTANLGSQSRFP